MDPVKCIVAGTNANGAPDLFFVQVRCSESQYENGDHYEAARNAALSHGYEAPLVAFDQNDEAGYAILRIFEWSSASVIDITPPPISTLPVQAIAARTKHPNTAQSDLLRVVEHIVTLSDGTTREVSATDPGHAINIVRNALFSEETATASTR